MLFYASEKYPLEDSYSTYISEGLEKLALARGEGTSSSGMHAQNDTSNDLDDGFDMFVENDDKNATVNPSNDTTTAVVWGYYYDPSSRLYCNAASGQWDKSFSGHSFSYQESIAVSTAEIKEATAYEVTGNGPSCGHDMFAVASELDKSMIGHLLGAAGVVEAVATVVVLRFKFYLCVGLLIR